MRDVRTLRTLALLDLESHPPPAAIDRVTDRHRSDAGPRAAAHAVHARAADARAAVDAARAPRRADGAGPHRRAGDGRLVPSRRVRDEAVRDRSRRRSQITRSTQPEIADDPRSSQPRDRQTLRALRPLRRCRPRCAAAASRCRRASAVDATAVPCASRRIAAASRAARCCSAAGPWRTSGEWWDASAQASRRSQRDGQAGPDAGHRDDARGCRHRRRVLRDLGSRRVGRALSDGAVYPMFRDRDDRRRGSSTRSLI